MTVPLLDVCHEVLHCILERLHPVDISAFSQTCKAFYLYTQNNDFLWRSVYLQYYDDPRSSTPGRIPDWDKELQQLTKVEKIFRTRKEENKSTQIELVCNTAIRLATEAELSEDSKNLEFLRSHFDDTKQRCRTNAAIFIHASSLYSKQSQKRRGIVVPFEQTQKIAHLHVMHGIRGVPIVNLRLESHMEARRQGS